MDGKDTVSVLTKASRRFTEIDVETLQEWDGELPPEVIRLSALGRAYGRDLELMPEEEISAVSDAVERLMESDRGKVRDLISTGFLEALAVEAYALGNMQDVLRTLGPHSRQYCEAWTAGT